MNSGTFKFSDECNVTLPTGDVLRVLAEDHSDYPGISIWLQHSDPALSEELLSIVEFNRDRTPGTEICIGAYCAGEDEPTYYKSYDDLKGEN